MGHNPPEIVLPPLGIMGKQQSKKGSEHGEGHIVHQNTYPGHALYFTQCVAQGSGHCSHYMAEI